MLKRIRVFLKKLCFILSAAIICAVPIIFCGCAGNNKYSGLLRLHVRANSDGAADQAVKLKVRDAVNDYISRNVRRASFAEAYAEVGERLDSITAVADAALRAEGFDYGVECRLGVEFFPTRAYGTVVLPEGYYDALIIGLGEAKGDNWWCVIYPPLCYGDSFEYKSFFAELFG